MNQAAVPAVRELRERDADALARAICSGFAAPQVFADGGRYTALLEHGLWLGAEHPDNPAELVATSGQFDISVGMPGGTVEAVHGLSVVTVRPDFVRRGLMRDMLSRHFSHARENGYAWSALTATEAGIYGRFGYAPAITAASITLESSAFSAADREGYAFEFHTAADVPAERMSAIERRVAARRPGTIVLGETTFADVLTLPPFNGGTDELRRVVIATKDGADVGFCLFSRVRRDSSHADCGSIVGEDAAASRAIASWLTTLDRFQQIKVGAVAPDSELIWHPGGVDAQISSLRHYLWLKVLDGERALRSRMYASECDLVIELTPAIADAGAAEHLGTYRLAAKPGAPPTVERVTSSPDVTMPENTFVALALGGTPPTAAQNFVHTDHTPGAFATLVRACHDGTYPTPSTGF